MMEKLLLEPGAIVCVLNVTLPAGKAVTFQPHAHKFTKMSNPRAVLENKLSKFSCLTLGQSVPVLHLNTVYWLDVVKLSTAAGETQGGVSIVETDISVRHLCLF